jgi:hypothetical protein
MSVLRGRYSGSPESTFDFDIRQISASGTVAYGESVIANELPDSFWTGMLPQLMGTSATSSPYFKCFQAAQIKLLDKGFLSKDITVLDLLLNHCDVHHLFPKQHLKGEGKTKGSYNQIANFVVAQSEINIAIGAKPPKQYFGELNAQVSGGPKKYGNIIDRDELLENLEMNCVPPEILSEAPPAYDQFLELRKKMMALRIKKWFESL